MDYIYDAFEDRPLHQIKGNKYLINTLGDHIPITSPEFVRQVVDELSRITDFSRCDKIIGDEDRGGHITAITAFEMNKPYSLVKWYPAGVTGEASTEFRSAYAEGRMYLNSIFRNDKVMIVEDFIDTGGTIIGMVDLLRKIGAEVVDIIGVVEKVDFGAHERIKESTGIDPKVLVSVSIEGQTSKVVRRNRPA